MDRLANGEAQAARPPGTDQLTMRALRRDRVESEEDFPRDVAELQHLLGPVQPGQRLVAMPGAGTNVPIWLLGSSLFSARLAAERGLPYAFASHFAPGLLLQALDLYRRAFQPSAVLAQPYTMIGVPLIAAPTEVNFSLSTDNGAVLYEVRTREARVVLPATVRLDPGARYAWRVATSMGQGPEQSAIAGFATATVELAEEVRRLRPTERAAVSDLVAYALWLGQERLQGEADRYWRLVQQRRPGEPAPASQPWRG